MGGVLPEWKFVFPECVKKQCAIFLLEGTKTSVHVSYINPPNTNGYMKKKVLEGACSYEFPISRIRLLWQMGLTQMAVLLCLHSFTHHVDFPPLHFLWTLPHRQAIGKCHGFDATHEPAASGAGGPTAPASQVALIGERGEAVGTTQHHLGLSSSRLD